MLFTPGPTEIEPEVREIGATSLPYFRGNEYTEMILALSHDLKPLFGTTQMPLMLTSSGSGTMEMSIQNLTNAGDRVAVINGGTFGKKWVSMCKAFGLEVTEIETAYGHHPDFKRVEDALEQGVSAVFATAHETSTGYLTDIAALGQVVKRYPALFIVDAVSSIGADPFLMDDWHVDCTFVSTQKALACMPGLSMIAFSDKAEARFDSISRHRYYFDAEEYLVNATRGMIPYTPAMLATVQLKERMRLIHDQGLDQYLEAHARKAQVFRDHMLASPGFSLFPERCTNSMTTVNLPQGITMTQVITYLRETYQWYVAPNPTKVESYLRVSHMGAISTDDLVLLVERINEACHQVGNQASAVG